jgi:site-specific recombinase XerD
MGKDSIFLEKEIVDARQTIEKEFEEYLIHNGIALKTIESYTTDVRFFNDFIQERGVKDIASLKRFYITNYKQWMQELGYMEKEYLNEQVVFLGKD